MEVGAGNPLRAGQVVQVLQGGLAPVLQENIQQWNCNSDVRANTELQPIFIPF